MKKVILATVTACFLISSSASAGSKGRAHIQSAVLATAAAVLGVFVGIHPVIKRIQTESHFDGIASMDEVQAKLPEIWKVIDTRNAHTSGRPRSPLTPTHITLTTID